MTDIARLGFKTDTADLTTATVKLDKLTGSAARAEVAANKTSKAVKDAGSASLAAATGNDRFKSSLDTIAMASGRSSKAALNASASAHSLATASIGGASANLHFAKSLDLTTMAMLDMGTAATKATGQTNQMIASMQRGSLTAGQMQSNFTNVAAQFQDIGVTAAMGMNPLMIGLQQGAQLSGVLAMQGMTAAGAIRLLGSAFLSVLSPLSLLIIGFTTLLAAGIQMIDWTAAAKSGLNLLADAIQALGPYLLAAAGALAIAFAPAIIGSIYAMAAAIGTTLFSALARATTGMIAFSLANPFAAMVIGIGLVVAAAIAMGDTLTKILGFDIVRAIKTGVNFLVGSMVGAYNTVVDTWRMLPDAMGDIGIRAANALSLPINRKVNELIDTINNMVVFRNTETGESTRLFNIPKISTTPMNNPYSGSAAKVGDIAQRNMSQARSVDYVGGGVRALGDAADWAAGKIRGWGDSLSADDKKKSEAKKSAEAKKRDEETRVEKFAGIMTGADNTIADLEAEGLMIGMVGEELAVAKAKQDLLNQARAEGIKLTAQELQLIDEKAQKIGMISATNDEYKYYIDRKNALEESNDLLAAEAKTIGMSKEAAAAYMFEQQLLNDEKYRGIQLNEDEIETLKRLDASRVRSQEEIRKTREAIEFAKSTTRGFIDDMRQGLMQGESIWKAFGNAVINVINRIVDRLIESQLDKLFEGMTGDSLGGLGGLFGIGKGGAINESGAIAHAKGGVFSDATSFSFGRGKLGVLGEAGQPEAVMPLQRGANGSLGVQMFGAQQSNKPGNITVEVKNNYTISGAISSNDVIELTKASAERTKTEVKGQLMEWLGQIQRDGGVVG